MTNRPLLPETRVHPTARAAMAALHAETVREVADTVARERIVVVGMKQNPVVKQARKALAEAGLSYTYLEYGSYLSEWRRRLAIKLWSGWPTFPQVFVRGQLIGGSDDLRRLLKAGELAQLLEAK
jgi:glutaredoxin-related protein